LSKFIIFANCIITRGKNQGVLADLQFGKIVLIPVYYLDLIDILVDKPEEQIESLKAANENVSGFVDFLIQNNFAAYVENDIVLPPLKVVFKTPFSITNAILEAESLDMLLDQYKYMTTNEVKYIEIRIYFKITEQEVAHFFQVIQEGDSLITELTLNLADGSLCEQHYLDNVLKRYPFVKSINIFNNRNLNNDLPRLIYVSNMLSNKLCGSVDTELFACNNKMFSEANSRNSCLNRKISVDTNGDIKNCPSMSESYGNIKDTTLEVAMSKPGFKKYWNVTKDQIEICKDCEFRYVCTDCRAYTERTTFKEELDLSKPLKCGYNPYTNEWAEWSTNPLKEKAIAYYGMEDLVKKNVK
jgi:SPASM domain peptide maturase of grasp-with-spasm system